MIMGATSLFESI